MDATQSKHRVLLTQPVSDAAWRRLELFFDVEFRLLNRRLERDELVASLADKAGVMTTTLHCFDAPLLKALPHLKAVCNMEPDYHNLDLEALTAAGIRATNTPRTASTSLTNSAWDKLLDVMRENFIPPASGSASLGGYSTKWRRNAILGVNPQAFTVGLQGDGPLLQSLANRAQAAGMRVIAPTGTAVLDVTVRTPEEFWASADFIIVVAPPVDGSWPFGIEQIALMKPGAKVIVVGAAMLADAPASMRAVLADRLLECRLDAPAASLSAAEIDFTRLAAENLIASLGFGRHGWHPPDLLNPDVICESCC